MTGGAKNGSLFTAPEQHQLEKGVVAVFERRKGQFASPFCWLFLLTPGQPFSADSQGPTCPPFSHAPAPHSRELPVCFLVSFARPEVEHGGRRLTPWGLSCTEPTSAVGTACSSAVPPTPARGSDLPSSSNPSELLVWEADTQALACAHTHSHTRRHIHTHTHTQTHPHFSFGCRTSQEFQNGQGLMWAWAKG